MLQEWSPHVNSEIKKEDLVEAAILIINTLLHQDTNSQRWVRSETNATNLNRTSGTKKPLETIRSSSVFLVQSKKLWRISTLLLLTLDLPGCQVSQFQTFRQTLHQLTANKLFKWRTVWVLKDTEQQSSHSIYHLSWVQQFFRSQVQKWVSLMDILQDLKVEWKWYNLV